MDYLNAQGDVVYLRGTPEILFRHLKMGKGVRPLLLGKSDEELLAFIREQLSKREEFYMKAAHIVNIPCMEDEDKITETIAKVKKELGIDN
jgi:shikimate kinase